MRFRHITAVAGLAPVCAVTVAIGPAARAQQSDAPLTFTIYSGPAMIRHAPPHPHAL